MVCEKAALKRGSPSAATIFPPSGLLAIVPSSPIPPLKAVPLVLGKIKESTVEPLPQPPALQTEVQSVTLEAHVGPAWQKSPPGLLRVVRGEVAILYQVRFSASGQP